MVLTSCISRRLVKLVFWRAEYRASLKRSAKCKRSPLLGGNGEPEGSSDLPLGRLRRPLGIVSDQYLFLVCRAQYPYFRAQ